MRWFHDGLTSAGVLGFACLFGIWSALLGGALWIVARTTRSRRAEAMLPRPSRVNATQPVDRSSTHE